MENLPFYSSEELPAPSCLVEPHFERFRAFLDTKQLQLCRKSIAEAVLNVRTSTHDLEASCDGTEGTGRRCKIHILLFC